MSEQDPKEWTIIIYMAGDNNLSEEMIRSINEIKLGSVASRPAPPEGYGGGMGTANVDFAVQYDGLHPNVKTRRYFDFFNSELPFDELPDEKDNMAIDEKIKEFVTLAIEKKPARNYALILSGHTDAFQGRTLLADENPAGVTTIAKLRKALGELVAKEIGNKPANEKFKLLGFDSCVMNTFEVMYDFKEITDVWVGSQGSIPNYTWDYRAIASDLAANTDPSLLTTEFIARKIIEKTRDFNKVYAFGGRSIDISASRLYDTAGLENNIGILAAALLDLIDPPETPWHKLLLRMLTNVHWKCQTFMLHQSVDLKDFCLNLKEECAEVVAELGALCQSPVNSEIIEKLNELSAICDQTIREVEKVAFFGSITGLNYRFANGVSMFFPWSILTLKMSWPNYIGELKGQGGDFENGLGFLKTDNGVLWFFLILVVTICTMKEGSEMLSSAKLKALTHLLHVNDTFSEKINRLSWTLKGLLIEVIGHRDDQPRSRGLDAYAAYFGETKNLGLILDIIRNFPLPPEKPSDAESE